MLSLMLCFWGKTHVQLWSVFFILFFCLLHVWKRDNKTTNVDQMCHILILLQHVQRAMSLSLLSMFCFFFFFLDKHYKPRPAQLHQHTTLLMAYVLFFCCKIILKKEEKNSKKQFASSSTAVSFSCPGCSRWSSQQVYYCNLNKDNRRMK